MTKLIRHGLTVLAAVTVMAGSISAQRAQRREPPAAAIWLSGTYELESTRGDSPRQAADDATRNLSRIERDRVYQSLVDRLEPPAMMSFDRVGRSVTISSSDGPRVTFEADGRTRQERIGGRWNTSTRAEFVGDRLSVSSRGNRSTDFLVTFEPLDRGESLLITREMDNDDLRRPVSVRSYYHRISRDPRWDLFRGGPADVRSAPRRFVVPDGTRLIAELDTPIISRSTRSGEHFTMTVNAPSEFRGARIDGTVGRVTPYGNGRSAELRLYFDTIRYRGDTSDFEGVLGSVRLPGGGTLRTDEARDRDDDRVNNNDKTAESGAIGAALGAIIGAFAGGGKGAAIGAVIGGVGGVISAQGRDEYLDLPRGTEVTVVATGRGR